MGIENGVGRMVQSGARVIGQSSINGNVGFLCAIGEVGLLDGARGVEGDSGIADEATSGLLHDCCARGSLIEDFPYRGAKLLVV